MWEIPDNIDEASANNIVDAALRKRDKPSTHADGALHSGSTPFVTTTFPGVPEAVFRQWLGHRLVFWPDGICWLKRVAVISSRLGLRHDRFRWWYDLLRTAVLRTREGECLCVASGTTAFAATCRAAELFDVPLLRLEVPSNSNDECSHRELAKWLLRSIGKHRSADNQTDAACRGERDPGNHGWRAVISPCLTGTTDSDSCLVSQNGVSAEREHPGIAAGAVGDRALVLAGQRTVVVSCRAGGNIEQLLQRKLCAQPDDGTVTLMASSPGVPSSVSKSLVEQGAVPWIVSGLTVPAATFDVAPPDAKPAKAAKTCTQSDGPLEQPDQWLAHWTRPGFGPWPDQNEEDYLDELILGCDSSNRSALAALLRIASTGKLAASRHSVRGTADVVSFTAVPLTEFRQRRVFRRHRHRFDFEPCGVAVRRTALRELGARPVIYGDESQRLELAESQQVFFQPASNRSGSIHWSDEREWRLVGSLNLRQLAQDDVCLFVDTRRQAALFSEFPWHVVVCPD
ncbi:MAG: hypothetical protein R3C19_25655 [Planctomycetaceae bacterium]